MAWPAKRIWVLCDIEICKKCWKERNFDHSKLELVIFCRRFGSISVVIFGSERIAGIGRVARVHSFEMQLNKKTHLAADSNVQPAAAWLTLCIANNYTLFLPRVSCVTYTTGFGFISRCQHRQRHQHRHGSSHVTGQWLSRGTLATIHNIHFQK